MHSHPRQRSIPSAATRSVIYGNRQREVPVRRERWRMPPALLTRGIGGLTFADEVRKETFLKAAPPFLSRLAAALGLRADIELVPGTKRESGIGRLVSPELVIELAEPSGSADGLRFVCARPGDDQAAPFERRAQDLRHEGDLDDFVDQVRQHFLAR